ncbi:MAG: AzlD domain-containing protein [Burkholderiaceae bacterium]|jgi:branched-subunit amino acid transport protein|nr:MAG: AzlD domain-containing protein [Burkholderiaceae bacterium]
MTESDLWMLLVIAGLTVVSVVTRTFFFISEREWPLPAWVSHGLRYAPIAALAAITAPDIVMQHGQSALSWADPRLWSALATAAYYFYSWRRGGSLALPMAIIVGLMVYLPLQLIVTA